MLRNCVRIAFVAVAFASLVVAGCGSQQAKTTPAPPPAQSKIGVIDMDKAIKAHPRYADVVRMQQEYAALTANVGADRGMPSAVDPSGLEQAAAKEFDARMAAKDAAIKTRLQAAVDQINQDIKTELDAYAAELDKDYQPQLFNLQLKLKTVQLSKEDGAAVQVEVDKLQQERAGKIAARHEELMKKADATMNAKQGEREQELAAYARTLNAELASKVAGQQAEATGRLTAPGQTGGGAAADKLAAADRDIASLQDFIIIDITDKVAKVAAEKGLDTVLAGVRVNVSATDITDAVIAEFKK